MDVELPDYLPILGYGLSSRAPESARRTPAGAEDGGGSGHSLSALLSRLLLAFAIEFEREAELPLAIGANVLRVLDEKGVRVRDLPILTGVSKEAIGMAMGVLRKRLEAVVEPDPGESRSKVACLTPKGRRVQNEDRRLLGALEERWQARFGKAAMRRTRASLESLVGEPTAERPPLFRGLEPLPDGWRASIRKPATLPHYIPWCCTAAGSLTAVDPGSQRAGPPERRSLERPVRVWLESVRSGAADVDGVAGPDRYRPQDLDLALGQPQTVLLQLAHGFLRDRQFLEYVLLHGASPCNSRPPWIRRSTK
jgi:hypothetical protein